MSFVDTFFALDTPVSPGRTRPDTCVSGGHASARAEAEAPGLGLKGLSKDAVRQVVLRHKQGVIEDRRGRPPALEEEGGQAEEDEEEWMDWVPWHTVGTSADASSSSSS